ncbi:MAG: hypothetical protein J6W56_01805 [Prevotella sp.]|nr:hypothetical protein [Prevotella sp.]
MRKRMLWLSLMMAFSGLSAADQKRMVVVDIETLIPISGVNVTSKEGTVTTDSLGWFSVPDSCRSLAFSHVNYESRIVNMEEVNDTVYLISKLLNIKEVVVFGHAQYRDDMKALKKQLRLEKNEAALLAANPASGGNLLSLLGYIIPKKWRQSKKAARRERLKRILEEY